MPPSKDNGRTLTVAVHSHGFNVWAQLYGGLRTAKSSLSLPRSRDKWWWRKQATPSTSSLESLEVNVSPEASEKLPSVWSKYCQEELLGEGKYGHVWRCTDRATGDVAACKTITRLSKAMQARAEAEVAMMTSLCGHPNIVHLKEVFRDGRDIHMVMDYCNGGDLFDMIAASPGGMEEGVTKHIFWQVALAVSHCHKNGALHRDIKPENILLHQPMGSQGHPSKLLAKLCDFGLAARLGPSGEGVSGRAGSSPYSAPEVELGQVHSLPADMWSLGVVLCCMLTGSWPQFDEKGSPWPVGRKDWLAVSPDAVDLIRKCLELLPQDRPSIGDVLDNRWVNEM